VARIEAVGPHAHRGRTRYVAALDGQETHVVGPVVASVGLIFLIIGLASFFSAFGGGDPPRLFWCAFVGIPLLFIGGVMSLFGFMGAVARYTAAEQVPVASDAINDLAEGTQGAVKTVARAVAEGVKEAQTERKQ